MQLHQETLKTIAAMSKTRDLKKMNKLGTPQIKSTIGTLSHDSGLNLAKLIDEIRSSPSFQKAAKNFESKEQLPISWRDYLWSFVK